MVVHTSKMQQTEILHPDFTEPLPFERHRIIELIRRWGGASSDAMLDPACRYFSPPHIEGLIAYRLTSKCAVALGDPVCTKEDSIPLAEAFHQFCKEKKWALVYMSVSEQFANWSVSTFGGAYAEYGVELFMDPHDDPRNKRGTQASLVRRKVKHAIREGVSVTEYRGSDPVLEQAIEQVGSVWLEDRTGPQIHISNVYLFADRPGKRWFYASQNDKIIGVVVLNKLHSKEGWLLNHLMATPQAPGGTPEILVISALEALSRESCPFVTFSYVPAFQLGKLVGLNPLYSMLARGAYLIAKKIFRFNGPNKFWEKFDPQKEPSYILFTEQRIRLRILLGLMRALNTSL